MSLHTIHSHATMDSMKEAIDTLRKNRVYTLKEITHFMPWAKNGRTVRKILNADMHGPNFLHCEITGTGKGRRYLVQGKYLISYLKEYGPLLMGTVRNTHSHARNRTETTGRKSASRARK